MSNPCSSVGDAAWQPAVPCGHTAYTWNGISTSAGAIAASANSTVAAVPSPAVDGLITQKSAAIAAAGSAAAAAPAGSQAKSKPAKQPKKAKQAPEKGSPAAQAGDPSSSTRSLLLRPDFSSVRLIDIGANLTDDMFSGTYHGKPRHEADLDAVLKRALERGVERIVVTAGNAADSSKVLNLIDDLQAQERATQTQLFPRLFSTVGVHPTRACEWNGDEAHQQAYFDSLLSSIKRGLSCHPRTVVAIGECGLDYDRLHFSDRDSQLLHFEKHFDLVERVEADFGVRLPLFLHDRNTRGDFADALRRNRHRFGAGVVHSFTGTIDELRAHLELDLYIGINGCSLKTDDNLAALRHIPLDRLLLETDAPWCEIKNTHASAALVAPESKMNMVSKPENFQVGKAVKGRNEPGNMVHVLEAVSSFLGLDGVELAEIVRRNTMRVFFPDEDLHAQDAAKE